MKLCSVVLLSEHSCQLSRNLAGQSRKYWICPAVPNSPSADIIVRHYVLCTKGVWHKPNLSILPCFCPYITRFSGRGRWILCVVTDGAEIVGVAMQKKWAWPQTFARVSLSVPHPFLMSRGFFFFFFFFSIIIYASKQWIHE